MIYVYGDSHGMRSFKGLKLQHVNCSQVSITMHRIGRDKTIVGYSTSHLSTENTFVLVYGEVDCRCHVARQIQLDRDLHEICNELVTEYFDTISKSITTYKKIIVCAVIPQIRRNDYESLFGQITHQYPFIGTDAERIKYTNIVNGLIKEQCEKRGYTYFDGYNSYRRDDGTLDFAFSDKNVHLRENAQFLSEFEKLFE